jgi:hypothetical protein
MFMAFAALFSSIFELLMFLGAAALIYYIFISDWWRAQRAKHRETYSKSSNVEKIAQVKLVSDSRKDIEQFVTDNAQYLSNPMVAKLVARIESLKIDDVILADDNLKKRIAALPDQAQAEAEVEEEDAQATRSQRARN